MDYNDLSYTEKEKVRDEIARRVVKRLAVVAILVLVFVIGGVVSCMAIRPRYKVWQQEMAGKAEYAKAEQNRKIKTLEAQANLEAEKLNAQAEIENGSITPTYIQYLWVRQQGSLGDKTVIYIPTETSLPILEAGRKQ